jgi:hypothetical protein
MQLFIVALEALYGRLILLNNDELTTTAFVLVILKLDWLGLSMRVFGYQNYLFDFVL